MRAGISPHLDSFFKEVGFFVPIVLFGNAETEPSKNFSRLLAQSRLGITGAV
jgi:hypothetical protein